MPTKNNWIKDCSDKSFKDSGYSTKNKRKKDGSDVYQRRQEKGRRRRLLNRARKATKMAAMSVKTKREETAIAEPMVCLNILGSNLGSNLV